MLSKLFRLISSLFPCLLTALWAHASPTFSPFSPNYASHQTQRRYRGHIRMLQEPLDMNALNFLPLHVSVHLSTNPFVTVSHILKGKSLSTIQSSSLLLWVQLHCLPSLWPWCHQSSSLDRIINLSFAVDSASEIDTHVQNPLPSLNPPLRHHHHLVPPPSSLSQSVFLKIFLHVSSELP